jgi:hypothetical protein
MFCGDAARRLAPVPGISPINVTALVAAVGNANTFVHGRDLFAPACFPGLRGKPRARHGEVPVRIGSQGGNDHHTV